MFIKQILKQKQVTQSFKTVKSFSAAQKPNQKINKKQKQNKVTIDQAVTQIESKFGFKISENEQQKNKKLNYSQIYNPLKSTQELKVSEQKQQSDQHLFENLKENQKKQQLLNKLQKVESKEKTSFNSVFQTNEMKYFNNKIKEQQQKQENAQYLVHNLINEHENATTEYELPQEMKDEINNHVHQKESQLEEQILAYLGHNQFPNKAQELESWRKNQAIENIDFTPATMGVPEVYYPGSKKGPNPEDDMESFIEWYKQNMPIPYKLIMEQVQELHSNKIRNKNVPEFLQPFVDQGVGYSKDQDQSQVFTTKNEVNQAYISELDSLSSPLMQNMPEYDPFTAVEKIIFEEDTDINIEEAREEHELPVLPQFLKENHHHSMDLIDKWSIFRLHPILQNGLKQMQKIMKDIQENKDLNQRQVVVPTLYSYYNTLPEQLKNNVVVKNTVRNLERFKHDMSLQDKQLALNYACKLTMPLHPLVEEVFTDIIETEKYWVTAAEEEKLLVRDQPIEQEGEDNQIPEVEDDSQQLVIQQDWNKPPQFKADQTIEILPDLPLQFYDNDDGFWDWHKEEQIQNYEQVELPQFRPFFKH